MKFVFRLGCVAALSCAAISNTYAGLVAYYPFNGSGDDATGLNTNLTLMGDAGFGDSLHAGLGTALMLDGDGDGAIGQNFVKFATDDMTVVAWAYAVSLEPDWNTLVKNWGSTAGGQFHLGLGSGITNKLQNFRANGTFVQDPADFPEGEWVHTAFVLDSAVGEHRLYMNGVVVATVPYLEPNGQGSEHITGLGVGHKPNDDGTELSTNGGGPWNGFIDDVGLFDEALSSEQILQIYQNGLAGIQLDGTSVPPVDDTPGDFNGDGNVDGADFVIWQTNFPNNSGIATLGMGDANGDGNVDGADFVVWQTNFPTTAGSGVVPVPEPSAFALALLSGGGIVLWRRRKAHC